MFNWKKLKRKDYEDIGIIPTYSASYYVKDIGKKVPDDTWLLGEESCIHVIVLEEKGYKYHTLHYNYTLKDIVKMYKTNGTIKVLYDDALKGFIYEYNNYRDKSWYLVGVTQGYA